MVCCIAAVQHNVQAIEKGVESMENQIFVEIPFFWILLEVGGAFLLVRLSTGKFMPNKE